MRSRLGIIAVLAFLAGVAGFVVYLTTHDAAPVRAPSAPAATQPRTPRPAPAPRTPAPEPPRETKPLPVAKSAPAKDEGGTVIGHVTARAGGPVQGAEIFLHGPSAAGGEPAATTDESGGFVLSGLQPGSLGLSVTHLGFARGSANVTVRADAAVQTEIVLDPVCRVQGTVRSDGQPVAGVAVHIMDDTTDRTMNGTTETDGAGHYGLEQNVPGEVSLQLEIPSCGNTLVTAEWARASIVLTLGETRTVDFDIPRTDAVIDGTVLVDGQPPISCEISAEITSPIFEECERSSSTDADGHYRIEHVPAGTVALNVRANSLTQGRMVVRHHSAKFELSDGETFKADFVFPLGGAVRGTLTGLKAEEKGNVVAIAGDLDQMAALSVQDMLNLHKLMAGSANVEADGTFRIEGLDPGPYTLVAVGVSQNPDEVLPHIRSGFQSINVVEGSDVTADLTLR